MNRLATRWRVFALTVGVNLAGRFVSVAVSLISIPLALSYIGAERYGVLISVSSFLSLFGFLDLGIGNGLLNRLSTALGKDDLTQARRVTSSGFVMVLALSSASFLIAIPLIFVVNWHSALGISASISNREIDSLFVVTAAVLSCSLLANLISKIQLSAGSGANAAFYQLVGSACSLGLLILALQRGASLAVLAAILAGTPVFASWAGGIRFFLVEGRSLRPRPARADSDTVRALYGTGILFLALQVAGALAYQTDSVIIAHLIGAESVTKYAVHQKYFSVPTMLFSISNMVIWPLYSSAIAEGDFNWVWQTLKRALFLTTVACAVILTGLLFIGPIVFKVWLSNSHLWDAKLAVPLGIFVCLESIGACLAMYLNASHVFRFQVAIALAHLSLALLLKVTLCSRFGLVGIAYGNLGAYLVSVGIPYIWFYRRKVRPR